MHFQKSNVFKILFDLDGILEVKFFIEGILDFSFYLSINQKILSTEKKKNFTMFLGIKCCIKSC